MAQMTSTRRKLAIATWAPPAEGNIFGKVTIDVSEALRYIEHVRETTGEKISITHLVGKAAGNALAKAPTLNGKILFGRFVPFDSVDVTYLIASDGDLAKSKIEHVDQKCSGSMRVTRRSRRLRACRSCCSWERSARSPR